MYRLPKFMKSTTAIVCIAVAGMLASAPLPAQTERQHGAHVHGEASGRVAVDDRLVHLELEIPGVNLVGFEHPPRDDAEVLTLAETVQWLETADNWLVADERGGCEYGPTEVRTSGYGDRPGHDQDHDHNRDRDQAHAHTHGHEAARDPDHRHDHAGFHVVARLQCRDAERLRWLELGLFERFPGNQRMNIDVFTDRVQTRARTRPGSLRIDLQ